MVCINKEIKAQTKKMLTRNIKLHNILYHCIYNQLFQSQVQLTLTDRYVAFNSMINILMTQFIDAYNTVRQL